MHFVAGYFNFFSSTVRPRCRAAIVYSSAYTKQNHGINAVYECVAGTKKLIICALINDDSRMQ